MKHDKFTVIKTLACLSIAFAGCGKSGVAPAVTPSLSTQAIEVTDTSPAMARIMNAWEKGDRPSALKLFMEADWTIKPLFMPGTVLALSEIDFVDLPSRKRAASATELLAKVRVIKELASPMAQAGRDAAAKGDVPQARRYFVSLQKCGDALNSTDCAAIVQAVGRAFKKLADAELAKLGP